MKYFKNNRELIDFVCRLPEMTHNEYCQFLRLHPNKLNFINRNTKRSYEMNFTLIRNVRGIHLSVKFPIEYIEKRYKDWYLPFLRNDKFKAKRKRLFNK